MRRSFGIFVVLLSSLVIMTSAGLLEKTTGLKVGDTAPDFKLKNVDGKMISLNSFKGAKGYIVAFTCNTCPFAQMYEDRLIKLHRKYEGQGYPVIAIQPNNPKSKPGDSFAEMKKRAKLKAYPFVYLFDEGQKVFPQYGASRTPEIYLLDANRVVRYTGAIDDNAQNAGAVNARYVEEAISALEAGGQPKTTITKAIGCTIKT